MNIPINFEKIDGVKFNIDGNQYYIEADNMEKGDCWVYEETVGFNPLCFDIDWEKETYELIKCEPGNGRHGNVLATDVPLTKHLMRDMDLFINHFLKDTIRTLIKNKSI
jgi:hypothetical protein